MAKIISYDEIKNENFFIRIFHLDLQKIYENIIFSKSLGEHDWILYNLNEKNIEDFVSDYCVSANFAVCELFPYDTFRTYSTYNEEMYCKVVKIKKILYNPLELYKYFCEVKKMEFSFLNAIKFFLFKCH